MGQDRKEQGLEHKKYAVMRMDREDRPGYKHDNCQLFVLDITHDPHARVAARAYADSAERDGYGKLATDLRYAVHEAETAG